jgi:hypothetical protein
MENIENTRVRLTPKILDYFFEHVFEGKVSTLSTEKGLPYTLIYNLVHGRVESLSAADYRRLFGEDPPYQEPVRVDGDLFRQMVKLWLFLNEEETEKALYTSFYPEKKDHKKIDYRIFSGATKTVEIRLQRAMEERFLQQGLDRQTIKQWIEELDLTSDEERIPFQKIKSLLPYFERTLNVHATRLLNQSVDRYQSGELKSVSKETYARLVRLKERVEKAVEESSRLKVDKLREEVYGSRPGFTLYSEVAEELEFLRKFTGRSGKKYLGRSTGPYQNSQIKRIASWRARIIREECRKLIEKKRKLALADLPKHYLKQELRPLINLLRWLSILRTGDEHGHMLEKKILTPESYFGLGYGEEGITFHSFDEAARIWKMSRRAFDLLVARHSDVFKKVAKYDAGWFLPKLYLEKTAKRKGFAVIQSKYETLAKGGKLLTSLM